LHDYIFVTDCGRLALLSDGALFRMRGNEFAGAVIAGD
jgi:hypothetical protein